MTAPGPRPPLRVVRVIARLNIGGPARQVVVLDDELRRQGCETLLVYGAPERAEGSLADLAIARGIPTAALPTLSRRISAGRDLVTAYRLLRILFAVEPDIVHTHTAKAGALGRMAAAAYNLTRPRARRSALVHTFHGNVFAGYFGRAGSAVARGIERSLARVTDGIVTLSAEQRDEITTRFAIAPADKVTVIAAGHDLSRLLAMPAGAAGGRADFGWSDRHVVMGYVGRLVAIKDLTTLVAAFAAVARTRDDVRLLIAGDGGERERLERLASDLGVRAAVAFAGWQTDLARLYATIDIVLLTSRNEGMPASLIEGMAAARAVVATRVGGVPELVADGQTGVLVSPGDIAAIADAMARLADNPALRRSLGEAARRAIGERFGPTRFAGDTLRFYHHVLEKRRGL